MERKGIYFLDHYEDVAAAGFCQKLNSLEKKPGLGESITLGWLFLMVHSASLRA